VIFTVRWPIDVEVRSPLLGSERNLAASGTDGLKSSRIGGKPRARTARKVEDQMSRLLVTGSLMHTRDGRHPRQRGLVSALADSPICPPGITRRVPRDCVGSGKHTYSIVGHVEWEELDDRQRTRVPPCCCAPPAIIIGSPVKH